MVGGSRHTLFGTETNKSPLPSSSISGFYHIDVYWLDSRGVARYAAHPLSQYRGTVLLTGTDYKSMTIAGQRNLFLLLWSLPLVPKWVSVQWCTGVLEISTTGLSFQNGVEFPSWVDSSKICRRFFRWDFSLVRHVSLMNDEC
jgi:hypothetical protein